MDEDKDTLVTGADGSAMHSLHAAKAGKINVRFLKTSPANAKLAQMYATQTAVSGLHGQNVITITDIARGDRITGRIAAFAKFPSLSYSKDGAMNEWAFNVGKIDFVLGSGLSF